MPQHEKSEKFNTITISYLEQTTIQIEPRFGVGCGDFQKPPTSRTLSIEQKNLISGIWRKAKGKSRPGGD
ncbi:hypothetical protein [Vibrio sp.]|uniref:hypothetical protein n=1 Tax=Vibrio sp. TaxID=678 RepID=UPI003F6B0F30